MSSANHSFSKLSTAALALAMLFASGIPIGAQTAAVGNVQITGVPDDWTHHHLVFSNPGTEEDAIKNNKRERWLKIVNDPRYVIQQLKRDSTAQGPAGPEVFTIQGIRGDARTRNIGTGEKTTKIEKDWSTTLVDGAATGTGTFTGNPTGGQTVTVDGTQLTASIPVQATGTVTIGTTSCFENGDGVTIGGTSLTTNATGGSGQLTVSADPGGSPGANETIGSIQYNVRTGSPGTTADRVESGTSPALTAQNLAAAINATATCGAPTGSSCYGTGTTANASVTASVSGALITLTGRCGGTGTVTLMPDGTDIKTTTAWNGGNNGTTSGTNFALNSTTSAPTNATIATQLGAAITANSSTGVTDTVASGVVSLKAVTGGTAGNVAVTSTADSGVTLAGMSGGTDAVNTGTDFAIDFVPNTTDNATNLAAAIVRNIPTVNATSSGATVTVTAATPGTGGNTIATTETLTNFSWSGSDLSGGTNAIGTVQPNAYPAKYGVSLTNASCSDFAIYPTGRAGATGAATIVAYDNLYTGGCSGTVPAAYWAYNTGNGQSVTTSPVLSLDGTQVAFIESNNASPAKASLVLIKWAAETGESVTAPLTLTNQASALAYYNCTPSAATPCMYTILFGNGDDDSLSAPFYDYDGDSLYVGDNNGNLHRFINVFNGQPSEDTSPWPVPLNANTNKIASPVYDETWHAVFVGDLGGKLYCVTATTGSCQTSPTSLGGGWYEASTTPVAGGQIADAPLINSSANYLLVFVNTSTANSIYGYSEQYFAGTAGGPVSVGAGANYHYLYAGSFDNVYYDSSNYTGNLYVVGNTGATTGASLYQVGLSGGFLTGGSTAVATGLTHNATGAYPWPSPLTEFCNNGANPCGAAAAATASGCTTTTGAKNITCTTAAFTSNEVGASITGTDIGTGSTITAVNSAISITVSVNSTAHTTTGTATIGAVTNPGTDYVFFSVNQGDVGGCTGTAGNGCILSYNVTNPSAVVISASTAGQNLVTPGTNGCWATGGLSIDNSAILTGASEIYFANLNGATAGGGANSGTPTSSACTTATGAINAVQASQSNP